MAVALVTGAALLAQSLRTIRNRDTGFEIVEWRGFGLLVARVFSTFGPRLPEAAEALARRFPVLQRVCVDLVVVCRKAAQAR